MKNQSRAVVQQPRTTKTLKTSHPKREGPLLKTKLSKTINNFIEISRNVRKFCCLKIRRKFQNIFHRTFNHLIFYWLYTSIAFDRKWALMMMMIINIVFKAFYQLCWASHINFILSFQSILYEILK